MKRANLREFEQKLRQNRLYVFNSTDLERLFGWSKTSIRFLLHRYTKRGITQRLKRNLYLLGGVYVPDSYIANRLFEPSYVSLETALSLHQIIPEIVYATTSITTKKTRRFTAVQKNFIYHHIKVKAFTGYRIFKQGNFTSLVAEPEKALVDYCYLVVHGQRRPLDLDRIRLGALKIKQIYKFARLYGDPRLTTLMKSLFPTHEI